MLDEQVQGKLSAMYAVANSEKEKEKSSEKKNPY
jgi:hypothetical protein